MGIYNGILQLIEEKNMTNDYIRREDAIIEMVDNNVDHAQGTDGRESEEYNGDEMVAESN